MMNLMPVSSASAPFSFVSAGKFFASGGPELLTSAKKESILGNKLLNLEETLVPVRMPFGLKIAIINRAFRKRMDEKAEKMGLTSVQLRVLGSVSRLEERGEGEIHQNDLEKIERVTHPAMTKIVQKLEAKGFLKCDVGVRDKRCKIISTTPKSKGIHNLILEQDGLVFDELCDSLSAEDRAELDRLISAILKNIDYS